MPATPSTPSPLTSWILATTPSMSSTPPCTSHRTRAPRVRAALSFGVIFPWAHHLSARLLRVCHRNEFVRDLRAIDHCASKVDATIPADVIEAIDKGRNPEWCTYETLYVATTVVFDTAANMLPLSCVVVKTKHQTDSLTHA